MASARVPRTGSRERNAAIRGARGGAERCGPRRRDRVRQIDSPPVAGGLRGTRRPSSRYSETVQRSSTELALVAGRAQPFAVTVMQRSCTNHSHAAQRGVRWTCAEIEFVKPAASVQRRAGVAFAPIPKFNPARLSRAGPRRGGCMRADRGAIGARFFSESGGGGSSRRVGMWGHGPYVIGSSSAMQRAADDVCSAPMSADEKS